MQPAPPQKNMLTGCLDSVQNQITSPDARNINSHVLPADEIVDSCSTPRLGKANGSLKTSVLPMLYRHTLTVPT